MITDISIIKLGKTQSDGKHGGVSGKDKVVKTLLKGLKLILDLYGIDSISLIEAWNSVLYELRQRNHIIHSLSDTSYYDGIVSLDFSRQDVICTAKVLSYRVIPFHSDLVVSELFGLTSNTGIFIRHILIDFLFK